MKKKLLMGLGSALILSTPILVVTSCGDNGNEAQDIKISSVTSKIEQDKVVVTVTGSKLPTDIAKWKIEESNIVSSQQPKEAGDTSNSIWNINASAASSTSIEFSAKYSEVAGKKYNFSLVGFPTVKTTVTCPTSNPNPKPNSK